MLPLELLSLRNLINVVLEFSDAKRCNSASLRQNEASDYRALEPEDNQWFISVRNTGTI